MPKLIINDEEYECRPNERLLSVARRNGSHIGFVCMGRGYCHTCACRVVSGAEYLSPPTEKELNWRKTAQLRSTYRLACQTFIQGEGTVEILSRAEELRRQASNVFAPPEGTTTLENFSELLGQIGSIVSHLPADAVGVASDIGKKRLFPRVQSDIAPKILENADPSVREAWEKIDRTTKRYTPNVKLLRRVLSDTNRMAQRMMGNPNGSPIAGMPEHPADPDEKRHNTPKMARTAKPEETQELTATETKPVTPTVPSIPVPIAIVVDDVAVVAIDEQADDESETPSKGTERSKPRKVKITTSK